MGDAAGGMGAEPTALAVATTAELAWPGDKSATLLELLDAG